MYIKALEINDIRSINTFRMRFESPVGWHVLIGDNGSGKSSIIRAISLGLIGPQEAHSLRLPFADWIQKGKERGDIRLEIERDQFFDEYFGPGALSVKPFQASVRISSDKKNSNKISTVSIENNTADDIDPFLHLWSDSDGWFSAAFGPFRRFTGGSNTERSKIHQSYPKAAAHLSVFGEDVALTESLEWLTHLKFQTLESQPDAIDSLYAITKFINNGKFLPNGVVLKDINSEGVFFVDGNGYRIDVNQLSDGFRSLLSMTFELIRQMILTFGEKEVFKNISEDIMTIGVPGIVLIDEVDAHLHPAWQIRIGEWFTKYFPNIQFIVTTHSPLVCRACEKGTIWKLAAPGSNNESGEITGPDKDKLIYGNILDAYGTEIFGANITINKHSIEKIEELVNLNKKKMVGKTSRTEEIELDKLRKTFTTNDPIDL